MDKIKKLREQLEALRSELITLGELDDELTDVQEARYTEALDEFEAKRTELSAEETRQARLEEVRKYAIANPAAVESGDGATSVDSLTFQRQTKGEDIYDLTTIRQEIRGGRTVAGEMRDRAMRALEQAPRSMSATHKETVERHIERERSAGRHDIAEHILKTGSEQYRDDWRAYVSTGEIRATLSVSGVGALIPYAYDPTIILTNNGATNPIRGISDVRTITTDDFTFVTSAGVSAEWIAESTEVADATPTLGTVLVTAYKADAHVQLSMEAAMDSDFSSELTMLFSDARDRLEATAFATGTGSGQPHGIVTELGLVTASRVAGSSGAAGAADLVVADIFGLVSALPPKHRPSSSWVAEMTTWNAVRRLGSNANAANFWTDLNADVPSMLLGRPVYESSAMDSTIVSGSNDDVIILGDFRDGYGIVDRVGMFVLYNPLVLGSNRRPNGEVAWTAFWRVGARAKNANAFRMLRL